MKKEVIYGLVAISAIAVISFFLYKPDETGDFTEDQKTGWNLMKAAQNLCLSGETIGVSMDLTTEFQKGINASAGGERTNFKGAVGYLDEKIRNIQDTKTRDCLLEFKDKISACMMDSCESAMLPKSLDFQFSYQPTEATEFIISDQVFFGIQNRQNKRKLVKQNDDYYIDSFPFPGKGESINALISPLSKDGHLSKNEVSFTLKRVDDFPTENNTYARYHCSPDKGCILDKLSPELFELEQETANHIDSTFSIFSLAYAAKEVPRYWSTPSIEHLENHAKIQALGYTKFNVSSDAPLAIDADSYYFNVKVNGTYAHENGVTGEYRIQPLDPSKPLDIEFALQNLNFSGGNSGCDDISIEVSFLKDKNTVSSPMVLERNYVALRDARDKNFDKEGVNWHWGGNYVRADKGYDNEVFITSELVSNDLNFADHKSKIKSAVENMNSLKRQFDLTNMSFRGQPLLAVIRPPLTKISYGLVVGMVQKNGQISFTYDFATADALADYLVEQRNHNSEIRRLVEKEKYVYTIRGNDAYMQSPPICPGEGVI